jgi:magnesium-transporting ATPase (P-type)
MHYPNEDKVKIFVKGAPETIVLNCTSTYDEAGECMFLDDEYQNEILADTVDKEFTQKSLRVLAFAYKEYRKAEFDELKRNHNNFSSDIDKEEVFFKGLRLLAIFAMED